MRVSEWRSNSAAGQSIAAASLLTAGLLAAGGWRIPVLLDLLWLGATLASFALWLFRPADKRRRAIGLVALTLLLVLAFPFISADDERLWFVAPFDAQATFGEPEKQRYGVAAPAAQATIPTASLAVCPAVVSGERRAGERPVCALPREVQATGNHSPPSC